MQHALSTDRAKTTREPTANYDMQERQQQTWPPWPNGQGVGLLIRRLRVRVPQGVLTPVRMRRQWIEAKRSPADEGGLLACVAQLHCHMAG